MEFLPIPIATQVGCYRNEIPLGCKNPNGQCLGDETSQTHLYLCGSRADKAQEPNVAIIGNIEPVFQGFHTIQSNKDIHRQTLMELAGQGQVIRQELDSLIAKPHKSHVDSIHIIRQYKQLENIVKSLKNNDKP